MSVGALMRLALCAVVSWCTHAPHFVCSCRLVQSCTSLCVQLSVGALMCLTLCAVVGWCSHAPGFVCSCRLVPHFVCSCRFVQSCAPLCVQAAYRHARCQQGSEGRFPSGPGEAGWTSAGNLFKDHPHLSERRESYFSPVHIKYCEKVCDILGHQRT